MHGERVHCLVSAEGSKQPWLSVFLLLFWISVLVGQALTRIGVCPFSSGTFFLQSFNSMFILPCPQGGTEALSSPGSKPVREKRASAHLAEVHHSIPTWPIPPFSEVVAAARTLCLGHRHLALRVGETLTAAWVRWSQTGLWLHFLLHCQS